MSDYLLVLAPNISNKQEMNNYLPFRSRSILNIVDSAIKRIKRVTNQHKLLLLFDYFIGSQHPKSLSENLEDQIRNNVFQALIDCAVFDDPGIRDRAFIIINLYNRGMIGDYEIKDTMFLNNPAAGRNLEFLTMKRKIAVSSDGEIEILLVQNLLNQETRQLVINWIHQQIGLDRVL